MEAVRVVILLHDLHKVFPGEGFKHIELPSPLKEADVLASRMSRVATFTRDNFKGKSRLRYRLATRMPVSDKVPGKVGLIKELAVKNARGLHGKIYSSEKLSLLNEARANPFTSLKHHVLIACSLVENFIGQKKATMKGIVFCVDKAIPENPFKMIGECYSGKRKKLTMWLDNKYWKGGNSHVFISFKDTWNNIVGMNTRAVKLGNNVRAINSWSAALAELESGKEGI